MPVSKTEFLAKAIGLLRIHQGARARLSEGELAVTRKFVQIALTYVLEDCAPEDSAMVESISDSLESDNSTEIDKAIDLLSRLLEDICGK